MAVVLAAWLGAWSAHSHVLTRHRKLILDGLARARARGRRLGRELPADRAAALEDVLLAGGSTLEAARAAGCTQRTAQNYRARLRAEGRL